MIKVICLGKIKEKYFTDAVNEYKKRISKYTKIDVIELEDFDYDNKELVLQKERDEILKHINTKDYVITLEILGEMITSEKLAEKIALTFIKSSNITFIIGGSYGIHEDVKRISNYKLSFSKLTFPHKLFRIMLLEQIYRSYKINNNESYHK